VVPGVGVPEIRPALFRVRLKVARLLVPESAQVYVPEPPAAESVCE
jgi:hypothetical protein